MSRPKRKTLKHYKVYCEGDTEYNYINEMRKKEKLSISIKPINMEGGGYRAFLNQIKRDGEANCLAKFIIIDGDRVKKEGDAEKKNLKDLLDYCSIQNKSERIPHIVIVNCPDFEYVCCLHVKSYKGQDTKNFISKELGYASLEDFKKDTSVFHKMTEKGNSAQYMIAALIGKKNFITNKINIVKKNYSVKVVETEYDWNQIMARSSNFYEYYRVIDQLK